MKRMLVVIALITVMMVGASIMVFDLWVYAVSKETVTLHRVVMRDKTAFGEWRSHPAHFVNFDHLWFSVYGYRHPTMKDVQQTKEEGWWGKSVYVGKKK